MNFSVRENQVHTTVHMITTSGHRYLPVFLLKRIDNVPNHSLILVADLQVVDMPGDGAGAVINLSVGHTKIISILYEAKFTQE